MLIHGGSKTPGPRNRVQPNCARGPSIKENKILGPQSPVDPGWEGREQENLRRSSDHGESHTTSRRVRSKRTRAKGKERGTRNGRHTHAATGIIKIVGPTGMMINPPCMPLFVVASHTTHVPFSAVYV